jgi:hypothetical protein
MAIVIDPISDNVTTDKQTFKAISTPDYAMIELSVKQDPILNKLLRSVECGPHGDGIFVFMDFTERTTFASRHARFKKIVALNKLIDSKTMQVEDMDLSFVARSSFDRDLLRQRFLLHGKLYLNCTCDDGMTK